MVNKLKQTRSVIFKKISGKGKGKVSEGEEGIKKAFAEQFDENLAKNYYITGVKGEAKKITLPQELITWDQRLLK